MTTNYIFGKFNQLETLWTRFYEHPKGGWIMNMEAILKLVELIKKYQPTQILELGTGIGAATACMASSIGNSQILTVEQNEKLIEIAKELIPHELKKKITFEYKPATVIKPIQSIDPFRYWSSYMDIPWAKWDFIVIDGPGPFLYKDSLVDLPNGDIINLLPYLAPGTKIFIQGRKEATRLYKRFLGWYLSVVDDSSGYCLFERTKETLKDLIDFNNSDMSRGILMDAGYFE